MDLLQAPGVQRGWQDFAPAATLLLASVIGLVFAGLNPSGARGQYAVIVPAWYDRGQTARLVGQAGGDLVAMGRLANVAIVHSNHPNFVWTLYRTGAWLVVDPAHLRGCLGFDEAPIAAEAGA